MIVNFFPHFFGHITGISGQNTDFPVENPLISLSLRSSACALCQKDKFFSFFEYPVAVVITAEKTIGAYAESISIGPELMQNYGPTNVKS